MRMTPLDRVLLLVTGLLAAYQIAIGIDGLPTPPTLAYTIAFGVLLIAGLLLIIFGFEALDAPIVVVVSTIIPLALSLGLVWQHLAWLHAAYAVFAAAGFLAILITRSMRQHNRLPALVLALVHGVAGLIIFLLPVVLALQGALRPAFALVGTGGALIGVGGLLLSFLKAGKPILSRETILKILPGLLLLMTICFVLGFKFG
ncbi:MAG: hypothetical protein AB1894_26425 [Chloroflexota bacterium]